MTKRIPVWLFALLPLLIFLAVRAGVSYTESGEADLAFAPAHPAAGDLLSFTYDLKDPQGNPLRNADVTLRLSKVSALPVLLNASYLRNDRENVGEVFTTTLHSFDGRVEFQSVVWDPGGYDVHLRAVAPGLANPIDHTFHVSVAVALGAKVRTLLFNAAVLLAGLVTGRAAAGLKPPKRSIAATGSLVILAVAALAAAPSQTNAQTVSALQVQVNPSAPVQKGPPAEFTVKLTDAGQPVDAFVSLHHVDDRMPMLTFRTGARDGNVRFTYAFPDTAPYRLSVHGTPVGAAGAPFDRDFFFEVPPEHPAASSQALAMGTMLLTAAIGFAIGLMRGRIGAGQGAA